MDLLALADFNLVASNGGIGRASRASGRPKATLSRRVMELEQALGVRLIERGSRVLRLTLEGVALHNRTEGPLAELAEAVKTVGAASDQPRGQLRVSAPVVFSHVAMCRIAADFVAAYPDVRLAVTAEDRLVDLVEDGYDCVIRINPGTNGDLVGRCFLRDEMLIVAAPSVVGPQSDGKAEAADPVPAVVLASAPDDIVWRFTCGSRECTVVPEPVLRLSSLIMVHQAILAGAGVARLPRSMIGRDLARQRLVSWGVARDRSVAIWVLHTSRRLASRKVTAFVQFLCDAFPDGWPA